MSFGEFGQSFTRIHSFSGFPALRWRIAEVGAVSSR
jgi:hypothetical protein